MSRQSADRDERPMPIDQCSLVDNCFEEGHYDAAILLLNQLRSPQYRPSPAHIRQLVYISLYPPTIKNEERSLFDPCASPRKRHNASQAGRIVVSEETSIAAQKLLLSYAFTNVPAAIFSPIPGYPHLDVAIPHEADSTIDLLSYCILEAKDCWSLLCSGAIRTKRASSPVKGKRRTRTKSRDDNNDDENIVLPVAENCWPVLEWFITVFERDELSQTDTNPSYSPLLLSQLPILSGTEVRSDFNGPLDVLAFAYKETDPRRQELGSRLLNLLINISSTTYMLFPEFVEAVYGRLVTVSQDDFTRILATISTTIVGLRFKIFLCQKFIITHATTQNHLRPRPQRAPRPSASKAVPERTQEVEALPITSKTSIPASSEIVRLMELGLPIPAGGLNISPTILKSELLLAYGAFRTLYPAIDSDPEWPNFIHSESFSKSLDAAFGESLSRTGVFPSRTLVNATVSSW